MDVLLKHMRDQANRADSIETYTTAIRAWLRDHAGRPAGQRNDYDQRGVASLRGA